MTSFRKSLVPIALCVGFLCGCGSQGPTGLDASDQATTSDGPQIHNCLGLCGGTAHFDVDGSPLIIDPVTRQVQPQR